MRTSVRLKLDSVPPVLEFYLAYPDPTPAAVEAVGRLRGVSDRTRTLIATQLKAQGALSAGALARERVIPRLRLDLAHVVRIARAAAEHERDDELRASLRAGPLTRTIPLDAARAALDTATRYRDLLLRYGMPEGMLARLRRDLDRYCAALEQRADASATIAAANIDLARLADEARTIIRHLDALNRIRYAEDPESQAAWDRASMVRWGKAALRRGRSATIDPDSRPAASQ
jgi:hypothetical protein